MKKFKKWIKTCGFMIIILTVNIILCENAYAANKEASISAPVNIKAYRQSDTSIRIKWKTVKNADGYIVYRYNRSNRNYSKVHTVNGSKANEWIKWIDKNLETNKIYKYKIASYRNVNGKKHSSKLSDWVSAKTYRRNSKKINAQAPKLNKQKVYLGLCSDKKITAKVNPSKYGKNKKKQAFSTKVRWHSNNPSIATVDKNGVITAGTKTGTCNVYAKSHNGARTKVQVTVKNYARVKSYYNYNKDRDICLLIADYKKQIQNIAEYYSIHRVKDNETITFTLNNDAQVVISPANADIGNLKNDIETLLVDFPYFIDIEVSASCVDFILRLEDSEDSLSGHVMFWYDHSWNNLPYAQIASHWTAYKLNFNL